MSKHMLVIDMPRPQGCPDRITTLELANGIRELIFPGITPYIPSEVLDWAKVYFGTDTWYALGKLGPAHPFHFEYHSQNPGVLITWLPHDFDLSPGKFMSVYGTHLPGTAVPPTSSPE